MAGPRSFTATGDNTRDLKNLEEHVNAKGVKRGFRRVTAAWTLTPNDYTVAGDATGGAFSVTLPDARKSVGQVYVVKRLNAGANAVTLAASGTDLIDGAATKALGSQYAVMMVQAEANGATGAWHVLSAS